MRKISEEILKTIDYAIQRKTEKFNVSDFAALIVGTNGKYCTVKINNAAYKVKNGTNITFSVGDICLVHCINYDFNNKIIIAKL